MMTGSTPASATVWMRASGVRPSSRALSEVVSSSAAEPSEICEELPAVTTPSSRKAGRRPASFSSEVSRRMPSSAVTSPDGHDLVGEAALVGGGGGALVRGQRDLVELLAGELPAVGDHLRRQALGHEAAVVALEHLRREGAVAADHVGEHRHARHRLDAAGDDEVVVPGDEARGGEVHGLLARAALAVDGGAGHRLGEAGGERGVARDVDALLADLRDAAPQDVVDERGVDPGTGDEGVEHGGRQVAGVHSRQRLARLADADRRTNGSDDDGVAVAHVNSPGR